MRADADPSQMRERDDEADRPVTAHADGSDVIKEDYPGRTARIGGLAQQRSDQDIGSSGLIHDARSKAIVIGPKALETFRDAANTEVRAAFDHVDRRGTNPGPRAELRRSRQLVGPGVPLHHERGRGARCRYADRITRHVLLGCRARA